MRRASLETGTMAGAEEDSDGLLMACSNTTANCAMIGKSKSRFKGNSNPKASLNLEKTCVANSEWPPNSKKLP